MNISAITSNTLTSTEPGTARIPIQVLDQDDFLKLIVTQLANQDPMNPQKDTEFIAQMAQFSSLEQSKAMQLNMATMVSQQQLLQANGLIGRLVELDLGGGLVAAGVVSGVVVDAAGPRLIVDGQPYDMSQVLSVAPAPVTTGGTGEDTELTGTETETGTETSTETTEQGV
jgi:flagellar basal-body rod modification protein FlgD